MSFNTEVLLGPPQPAEDDPAFDCRYHGNQVCGTGNAQGVGPGDYSAIGILTAIAKGEPGPGVPVRVAASWEELLLPLPTS